MQLGAATTNARIAAVVPAHTDAVALSFPCFLRASTRLLASAKVGGGNFTNADSSRNKAASPANPAEAHWNRETTLQPTCIAISNAHAVFVPYAAISLRLC